MTTLKKPVKREFKSRLFDRHPLIIMIDPDGYLRLKQKRSRRVYSISFEALFYLMVRQDKDAGKKRGRG